MSTLALHPHGREALDDAAAPAELTRATLHDIARANALFGGAAAVTWGVERLLARHRQRNGAALTLLDVGAGAGDVARRVAQRLARRGVAVRPLALDRHPSAVQLCRGDGLAAILADASSIPFATRAVDIVIASQLLHHFHPAAASRLVEELARVARFGGVVADLRRSRAAQAGIWLASFALGFHPVSRHDGVISVRRGFTTAELQAVLTAGGASGSVHRRPGFRIVGIWETSDAHG